MINVALALKAEEALDERGQRIRLRRWCRRCAARLFVGYEDFTGGIWQRRFYETAEDSELRLQACPHCGADLAAAVPLTEHELWIRIEKARERMCAGGRLDAGTVVAIDADLAEALEDGRDFDEVAAMYGRTVETLRVELSAWLAQPEEAVAA